MDSNNKGIGYNKIRKKYLAEKCLINCAFCKYHKGENKNYHRPKSDRYKNISRKTIRRNKMNDKNKKLYVFNFKEYNWEQEYAYEKLICAYNADEAFEIGKEYLKTWYGDEDVEEIEYGFEFFGGAIIVKYMSIPYEINKEDYLEELFQEKLIN